MEFKHVIISNIPLMGASDLLEIKKAIEDYLGGDDLKVVALKIKQTESVLRAVKYVKDETGWDLRTAKNYVDNL